MCVEESWGDIVKVVDVVVVSLYSSLCQVAYVNIKYLKVVRLLSMLCLFLNLCIGSYQCGADSVST